MQYTKIFAIAALFAGSAFAAPAAEANPPKPTKPPQPTQPPSGPEQSNTCGNGAVPYCCNTDNFGYYTTCSTFGAISNQCSQTTVCCNANNSIQVCLGNAVITG